MKEMIFSIMMASFVCSAQALDLTKIPGVVAETGRAGFVFPAAKSIVVAEQISLARDVSSVCSFVIEDGPDEVDVSFQAGLKEVGGACGFSKSGAGTLRVEGDVSLGGVMTIYDGTQIQRAVIDRHHAT